MQNYNLQEEKIDQKLKGNQQLTANEVNNNILKNIILEMEKNQRLSIDSFYGFETKGGYVVASNNFIKTQTFNKKFPLSTFLNSELCLINNKAPQKNQVLLAPVQQDTYEQNDPNNPSKHLANAKRSLKAYKLFLEKNTEKYESGRLPILMVPVVQTGPTIFSSAPRDHFTLLIVDPNLKTATLYDAIGPMGALKRGNYDIGFYLYDTCKLRDDLKEILPDFERKPAVYLGVQHNNYHCGQWVAHLAYTTLRTYSSSQPEIFNTILKESCEQLLKTHVDIRFSGEDYTCPIDDSDKNAPTCQAPLMESNSSKEILTTNTASKNTITGFGFFGYIFGNTTNTLNISSSNNTNVTNAPCNDFSIINDNDDDSEEKDDDNSEKEISIDKNSNMNDAITGSQNNSTCDLSTINSSAIKNSKEETNTDDKHENNEDAIEKDDKIINSQINKI